MYPATPPAREEEQVRVRQEEEEVWSKALSGELSGPRKAAIGAAENVTGVQIEEPWDLITADKDDDLYTAMFKSTCVCVCVCVCVHACCVCVCACVCCVYVYTCVTGWVVTGVCQWYLFCSLVPRLYRVRRSWERGYLFCWYHYIAVVMSTPVYMYIHVHVPCVLTVRVCPIATVLGVY